MIKRLPTPFSTPFLVRPQTQAQRPTLSTLFPAGKRTAARLVTAYRRHGYRRAEITSYLGVHYATVSRWLKQAEERDV